MKEIFSVWGNTRQIVIIALTAAIYAGMLIPFKAIQIVPGLTELRPANVIPVLFGILFGPAAAWGSAIGNLIADFFGTLSPASAFGFVGNFFFLLYRLQALAYPGQGCGDHGLQADGNFHTDFNCGKPCLCDHHRFRRADSGTGAFQGSVYDYFHQQFAHVFHTGRHSHKSAL